MCGEVKIRSDKSVELSCIRSTGLSDRPLGLWSLISDQMLSRKLLEGLVTPAASVRELRRSKAGRQEPSQP